ncbi:hypothetical protein Hanom_Chr09g00800081 [Helianthus anomalus]
MSVICGSHLHTSVEKEVDKTSADCKKKNVCFLTYVKFKNKLVVVYGRWLWVGGGGGRWWWMVDGGGGWWTVVVDGGGGGGRWWVVDGGGWWTCLTVCIP